MWGNYVDIIGYLCTGQNSMITIAASNTHNFVKIRSISMGDNLFFTI